MAGWLAGWPAQHLEYVSRLILSTGVCLGLGFHDFRGLSDNQGFEDPHRDLGSRSGAHAGAGHAAGRHQGRGRHQWDHDPQPRIFVRFVPSTDTILGSTPPNVGICANTFLYTSRIVR